MTEQPKGDNTPAHSTWNGHLRGLSVKDFAALGVRQVAYVKLVALPEDRTAYVVHAADGTPLSVHEDGAAAIQTALHNELSPVTLH